MLKRIIEQYVAPLAAAAAGGASGAGAAGGAAGAAGGSAGGAAGGSAGGSAGGAAGGAAGEAAGGSIGSDAIKTVAGGKGPDLVTGGIRSAAKTVTTPINILSSIPESAGGRYRADLERIRAQRYASQRIWHPAVSHDESGDVYSGKSHEHALIEARKAGLPHDSSLYTFGFVNRDGDFYSEDELDNMQGLSS